jgi:hypothetical protein
LAGLITLLSTLGSTTIAGADEAARSLMIAIDTRYEELRSVPRRMEMRVAITRRTLGEPDRHFRGMATVTQLDRKARFEMDTVEEKSAAGADCAATPVGHLVWVIEGARLKMRFQPAATVASPSAGLAAPATIDAAPETQPIEPSALQEMRADFEQLPPELGLALRDPMGEPELGREFLNHPFTLRDGVLDGRPAKVLQSLSEVTFNRSSKAHVTLWVDPENLLILRLAYNGVYSPSDEGKGHEIVTETDLNYQFGVPLPDNIFSLDIGPEARDITDIIAREGRAALGLVP